MKHAIGLRAFLSATALSSLAFAAFPLRISKRVDVESRLGSRQTLDGALLNKIVYYQAQVQVGTPGQPMNLQIDTGSSDTWVIDVNAAVCQPQGTCKDGTYDRTKSSTFKEVAPGNFSIQYLDDTVAQGDYISETFALQGSSTSVKGLQMGLASFANTTSQSNLGVNGLLGIGYNTSEATTSHYPNLPDQLVAQGLINSKAYSLYLDDVNATTGSILFGGINTNQFVGTLSSVPVLQVGGGFTRLNVLLSSMTLNTGGVDTPLITPAAPKPVALDSGSSYSYLDDATAKAIYVATGAVDDMGGMNRVAWVDCNLRCTKYDEFFTFRFGSGSAGPVIKLPVAESILGPYSPPSRLKLPFKYACILTFKSAGQLSQPYYILGDNFLRSAYVVYDLESNEIALAQSNFEASASHIVDIPKGSKSIPLLSGVQSGVTRLPPESSCPPTSSTSSSAAVPTSSKTASGSQKPTTATTTPSTTLSSSATPPPSSSITSTYYTTTVYTITACPHTVTNCPIGSKTTSTIAVTTTFCPDASTPTPTYISSTVYTTLTYSSSGRLTTETRSLYVTLCPVTSSVASPVPTGGNTKSATVPASTSPVLFKGAASPVRISSGLLALAAVALLGFLAL